MAAPTSRWSFDSGRSGHVLPSLLALFSSGLLAGLLLPSDAWAWGTQAPLLVTLAVLVGLASAVVAYAGAGWSVPLFAVLPFLGLLVAHPGSVGSRAPTLSLAFVGHAAGSVLVLGASWGLAGGIVGYVAGTAARTATVDAADRPDLARRAVLVLAAAAVAAATFGTFWVQALGGGV